MLSSWSHWVALAPFAAHLREPVSHCPPCEDQEIWPGHLAPFILHKMYSTCSTVVSSLVFPAIHHLSAFSLVPVTWPVTAGIRLWASWMKGQEMLRPSTPAFLRFEQRAPQKRSCQRLPTYFTTRGMWAEVAGCVSRSEYWKAKPQRRETRRPYGFLAMAFTFGSDSFIFKTIFTRLVLFPSHLVS